MNKGGLSHRVDVAKMLRYFGLFFPIVLVVYGFLIQLDFIKINHYVDYFGMLIIMIWWIFIGIVQFLYPIKSNLEKMLFLLAYHLLLGIYIVFISGMSSPFILCWLILSILSYIAYDKKGVVLNLVFFAVFTVTDMVLWREVSCNLILIDFITFVILSIISCGLVFIFNQQKISKTELEQIKAQELSERDRISTLINNMADAVISTDNNGKIRIYNAASLNLLDTNNDLKGHMIDEILPLKNKDGDKISLFNELKNTHMTSKRDDLLISFGQGDEMRLEVTYAPVRSNYSHYHTSKPSDGYVIIMRDITKSKSLEEERDEFISVVSHELRTPIAIAEGTVSNAQLMLNHTDVTKQMLKDTMNTAHEQIVFLAGMVNDLSTLSRAERGVMADGEIIDVKELAHKLHDKYLDEAKKRHLHLNLDISAKLSPIYVSRLYIEEMLQNFITNAIKYTKEGSVTIQFKQKDGKINFAVKDTGIGISKSDQTKIFQKFFRSEDYRTRETSGTGLGLYIAHKLAGKIGTKIEFKSRLNFGSTFSFELPIYKQK